MTHTSGVWAQFRVWTCESVISKLERELVLWANLLTPISGVKAEARVWKCGFIVTGDRDLNMEGEADGCLLQV